MPSTGKASGRQSRPCHDNLECPHNLERPPNLKWRQWALFFGLFVSIFGTLLLNSAVAGTLDASAAHSTVTLSNDNLSGMAGSPTISDAALFGDNPPPGTITRGPLTIPASVWASTSVPALSGHTPPGSLPSSTAAKKASGIFFVAPATPTATAPASTTASAVVADSTEPAMPTQSPPYSHLAVIVSGLRSVIELSACKLGLPDYLLVGDINLGASSSISRLLNFLCNPGFLISGAMALFATCFLHCLLIKTAYLERTILGFKQASLRRAIASHRRSESEYSRLLDKSLMDEWRLSKQLMEAHRRLNDWVSRGTINDGVTARLRQQVDRLTRELATQQTAVHQLGSERADLARTKEALQISLDAETEKSSSLEASVIGLTAERDRQYRSAVASSTAYGTMADKFQFELRRATALEKELASAKSKLKVMADELDTARAVETDIRSRLGSQVKQTELLDAQQEALRSSYWALEADFKEQRARWELTKDHLGMPACTESPTVALPELTVSPSARSRVSSISAGSPQPQVRSSSSPPPEEQGSPESSSEAPKKKRFHRGQQLRDAAFYAKKKERYNARRAGQAAAGAAVAPQGAGEGVSSQQE